jgi:hypothetical protein
MHVSRHFSFNDPVVLANSCGCRRLRGLRALRLFSGWFNTFPMISYSLSHEKPSPLYSIYPSLWAATGISNSELIDQLIQLGLNARR